jgi:hypothetical protein
MRSNRDTKRPAQKTPLDLTANGSKGQFVTHAPRGQKQRIIIHLTMFGTAALPDRARQMNGPDSGLV